MNNLDNLDNKEREFVKCKVKYNYKLFPREEHISGEFAIMKFDIVELLEGNDLRQTETFKGNMCEVEWDEAYTVFAEKVIDDRYGLQYDIKWIGRPANLESEEDQRKFLSRILTPNQVENLYATFDNPIEIIQSKDIEKLCQVKGVGVYMAEKLIDRVAHSIDFSQAYVELDDYGLTNNMIEKLIDVYGSPEVVIQKIKDNPYILASEIDGIGFRKADEIALTNGYTYNDPKRLFHLSKYILDELANKGYSYIDAYTFMDRVYDETDDLDNATLGAVIKDNSDTFYTFDIEGERHIALQSVYELELSVAKELKRINNGLNEFDYEGWEEKVKQVEEQQGWKHTDEQLNAIEQLLKNQVQVITGFGGTGKSSTVSAVVNILDKYSFAQTALSGRAASRMAEITGEEGFTIHRLLGYNPRTGFFYTKENQLDIDIVILDELSMVGGNLCLQLLEAIPTGAKLIMLGDEGQLESIGMMNILTDLLESKTISSSQLTKIHRQAQKSGIIEVSMMIRNQEQIFESGFEGRVLMGELQDCELNITKNKSSLPQMIESDFEHWLEKMDDVLELQVIVPLKSRGDVSCSALNDRLQNIYNPIKKGIKTKKLTFTKDKKEYEIRVGDKIINRKNNYKTVDLEGKTTPIYNGNIGIVTSIDEGFRTMAVDFQGIGEIYINKEAMKGIELGYAITTHSSQGSQFDVVIYAIDHSAYMLLNKEQAYTGVTRAKKYCSIHAENKSLRLSINTSEISNKQTFLKGMLDDDLIQYVEVA